MQSILMVYLELGWFIGWLCVGGEQDIISRHTRDEKDDPFWVHDVERRQYRRLIWQLCLWLSKYYAPDHVVTRFAQIRHASASLPMSKNCVPPQQN